MNLQRLRTMGLSELTYRGRQEASKWLDRIGVNGNKNGGAQAIFKKMILNPALGEIQARARERNLEAAAQMLVNHLQEAGLGRFFVGAVGEQMTTILKEQMPSAREEIIAAAEAVCHGRFDLLGYRGLFFGDPIDWHLDPISGRRSPLVHWSRLDSLDPKVVGDSKVVWELNRHQWLVRLGQAYQLTGDERYAEAFRNYVQGWLRANPPGVGINWASSLELALRLISWCWVLFLFRSSEALSPQLFASMLEEISLHAAHVEKYLSYYFAPNTHLTGEALGLFYAGVLFPELRRARRWRDLGERILVEQSERQILPDGVYFEQSTCYQRYTVETYLHFLILARRNGVKVPAAIEERIPMVLDFLLAVRRPDGSIPHIGDSDGGWLLPLMPRDPGDVRGLFSTAAVLFKRHDYAWAAGGLAPETLWLLGPAALAAFAELQPTPPAMSPSRLFADGGYIVMRSGWGAEAHQLIFDVGPLGCPVSSGHGHADLLSIQCSVFGEPYLVDPGTYCYTAEPKWRDFFRSTAAHSTVTVDNADQAIPSGAFRWEMRPQARLRRWISTEVYDYADAEHDAYRCFPDPVAHRRQVAFINSRYWVVVDDLEGAAEHRVELRFQFAPIEVKVNSANWACVLGPAGRGLFIRPFAIVPLKAKVPEGELAPIQGWVSADYGQRQPAPLLSYCTVTRFPLRILTLLFPTEKPFDSPPVVSPLLGEGPMPVGLVFGDRQEVVIFNEHGVVLKRR